MAKFVREVMNSELLALRPTDGAEDALGYLLALSVSSAPVIDPQGRPVGFLSMKDVLSPTAGATVGDAMTPTVHTVLESATVDEAARELAASDLHHAPVVTDQGRVVGVVSAVDLLKALTGVPVSHPPAFPHYDRATGLTWTDDTNLDVDGAAWAPSGPGLLVLIAGGAGRSERVVWAEACNDVQARVHALSSLPQTDDPLLARILERDRVRFRAASVPDAERRRDVLGRLLEQTRRWMLPEGALEGTGAHEVS